MDKIRILFLTLFFAAAATCSGGGKRLPQILGESATPRFGYILTPPALTNCEPAAAPTRGKVVLYEFFASTCGYCAMMEPDLQNLAAKYRTQGLIVISISPEQMEEANQLVSPGANRVLCSDSPLFYNWQIDGVPYFVVVDRRGVTRFIIRGGSSEAAERLRNYVEELIEE